MKSFFRLVALSVPMLMLTGFNANSVLADSQRITSNPIQLTQATETETVELTIDPPLTPEQEAQLQAISTAYQPKLQAAAQEYTASLSAIDALLGTNPTNEKIRETYNQAQTKRNNLSNLLLDKLLEFRGVLTPEQQASLSDDIRSYIESAPENQ
jgi:Spy/CpxP family protein refolding chaperone